MITTSKEYYANLYKIQDSRKNKPDKSFRLPSTEPVYDIDLQTRTIKAPTYLSVAKDHAAETVYFRCDRYVENMDLSETVGVIQYINPLGDAAIYPIPYYDIITEENYIYFPWLISGKATAAPGNIDFSVRFYHISPEMDGDGNLINYILNFNLSTQKASSKILYGMDLTEEVQENYHITANILDEINMRLKEYADKAEICWIDLNETPAESLKGTDEDYKIITEIMK